MKAKVKKAWLAELTASLRQQGLTEDRYGNFMVPGNGFRVVIKDLVWRIERKTENKSWSLVKSGEHRDRLIPTVSVYTGPIKKAERLEVIRNAAKKPKVMLGYAPRKVTTKAEMAMEAKAAGVASAPKVAKPAEVKVAPPAAPIRINRNLTATLDPAQAARIDKMAFMQVSTASRVSALESTIKSLQATVLGMAAGVEEQLRRIKSPSVLTSAPEFCTRMFSKISIRLRKKSVDVQIEDTREGAKSRRIYRCAGWLQVEHLLTYRTLCDGIERIEVKPPKPRKVKAAPFKHTKRSKAVRKGRRVKTLAEVRDEMERDGLPNAIIPSKSSPFINEETAKKSAAVNLSRAKAERLIVKLCSPGSPHEGAKDRPLLDALCENGFPKEVAYYAALNCGRILDSSLAKEFAPSRKPAANGTANQY